MSIGESNDLHLLSFEPTSISRLVIRTSPIICVHSETILPTTCPHRLFASIARNAATQAAPVTTRNKVRECSRRNVITGESPSQCGRLLSDDPFSYKNFVITTVTTTPLQSAIAFPKNDPQCVDGSEC